LLVPSEADIATAWQFCAQHLTDCVGHVAIAPTESELSSAIQQSFEVGHARPLRIASTSSSLNALPAAFPINNTKRLVAAHALLFSLDGAIGVRMQHLPPAQPQALENICKLLRTRATQDAFAADSNSEVLDVPVEIFAVQRCANESRNKVICLVNVSREAQLISLDWRALLGTRHAIRDLVTGIRFNVHGPSLELQPHQVMWATL
jgi:hypothetical protein